MRWQRWGWPLLQLGIEKSEQMFCIGLPDREINWGPQGGRGWRAQAGPSSEVGMDPDEASSCENVPGSSRCPSAAVEKYGT